MNNCPKCGNPLQEGASSCPICGTNILEKNEAQAGSAVPAPPAPAPAPAPAPVAEAVATTPEAQAPQVESVLPTVERVESSNPIPNVIPSSLANPTVGFAEEEKPLVPNPKLEPKKKSKKTPLLVGLILIVVLGIGCFMALSPGKTKKSIFNKAPEEEEISLSSMSSNGYHLNVAEGWQINEDGTNVILTNNDNTVAIKLEHSNSNLANIKTADIEKIMNNNESYKDVEVSEVDVSGKSSYLVSTNINELPVQIYFINGGNNLIIGATIVYQSNDSKTKYEAAVMEMIGSLSYAEDSIKAVETISAYSQMFGIFNNITINAPRMDEEPEDKPEEKPENPDDNQQDNHQDNQQDDQQDNQQDESNDDNQGNDPDNLNNE